MSPDVIGFIFWLACILVALGVILIIKPKDHL